MKRLNPEILYSTLRVNNISYFCGVPDSIISSFSFYLEENAKACHDIAANEGNAVGMAIGYHIATGKIPLVYMQNSGLNNAIDPLGSLADSSVFSIPIILLISWRGQPHTQDEPQHTKQGAITEALLKSLGIPYVILSNDPTTVQEQIAAAIDNTTKHKSPYALLISKDSFVEYNIEPKSKGPYALSREEAVSIIASSLSDSDVIVAGIGKVSRELFEYRESHKLKHRKDLLIIGGMGHASSIALGIAMQKPNKKVYCLDGDGSLLMHLGAVTTIGHKKPTNFYHIVMNNGSHDSVGGQPTVAFSIDLLKIAKASGYGRVYCVQNANELESVLHVSNSLDGPVFIEVRLHRGARLDLPRPSISPRDNKDAFMTFLRETNT